jgi:hypothetical protein
VAAAIPRSQGPNAAVAGLTFPNRGSYAIGILQEGELAVVDAGGGTETQHITLQRNALQGQVLVHIALNQIADGVGDPEVGHWEGT